MQFAEALDGMMLLPPLEFVQPRVWRAPSCLQPADCDAPGLCGERFENGLDCDEMVRDAQGCGVLKCGVHSHGVR